MTRKSGRMVRLMRHRQTKGPVSARSHLNRRAAPRLHSLMANFANYLLSELFRAGRDRAGRDRAGRDSFPRKIPVVLDLANLLDVALGVRGDLQHPLPAIDYLLITEAVGPHVVVGSLDVFDHRGAQRLKLPECLAQVLVGVDFFVPTAGLSMHHTIDT